MAIVAATAALAAVAGCSARERLGAPPMPEPDAEAQPTFDAGSSGDAGAGQAPEAGEPPPAWVEMSAPGELASGATLTDMWAADDDTLFVTAYVECLPHAAQCLGRTPLVLRWRRGVGWNTEEGLPALGWTPRSIHGTSADDVWTVGEDAIYHRDAGGWSLVDPSWQLVTAGGSTQPISLQSVRAFPGGEVWAVSTKFVLHRVGGIWSATLIPPAPDDTTPGSGEQLLSRLWAFSPDEVWVSGSWVHVGSTMTPSFLCRAETAPIDCIYPTDGSRFGVASMFGAGDGRVWVTVPNYTDGNDAPIPLQLIDWDAGKTVTAASVEGWPGNEPLELVSMWGRSAQDIWAVGSAPQYSDPVVHFDGRHWTLFAAQPAPDEWCTLVTGGPHALFVATSTGRIFRLGQTGGP